MKRKKKKIKLLYSCMMMCVRMLVNRLLYFKRYHICINELIEIALLTCSRTGGVKVIHGAYNEASKPHSPLSLHDQLSPPHQITLI
jgi:hypothetical protein